ncbi:MAG: FeoA domain-containing protein [Thermoplasmata archaeon]|nr:FeoA domain-containing protein [Thermoplasmata archaeon]
MSEDRSLIKIVKEDILRILAEREGKVTTENLTGEVSSSKSLEQSLGELERDGFIKIMDNKISATKKGMENGKDILEKHLLLERYFKKTKGEGDAHQIAHLMEHYISKEVASNIEALSSMRDKGIALIKIKEGIIVDIDVDMDLFERVISMGIFPGEGVRVVSVLPNVVVVEIKNKKFALDRDIADRIKGIET